MIGGIDAEGTWSIPLLAGHKFHAGEVFMFESTGGGGWGNPKRRTVEEVLDDVLDEYISLEAAEKHYGVVIDPQTLQVNAAATQALRG